MAEKTIYNKLFQFFTSLIVDFCSNSTAELSNTLTVFNPHSFASPKNEPSSSAPLSSLITDAKLSNCIKYGLEFFKTFVKRMESDGGGIPVTGGSVEAWRMENVAVDIVSHNIKLHRVSEFVMDELKIKLKEGIIELKSRWPDPYLSQSYVLSGFLGGKKATGSGDLKILITNFKLDLKLKFTDRGNFLEVDDFKLRADFDDARIQVSGLTVEDAGNAEEILNTALQRDKQKIKETLSTNTIVLSEQTTVVMNAKLQETTKKQIVDIITTWCEKK